MVLVFILVLIIIVLKLIALLSIFIDIVIGIHIEISIGINNYIAINTDIQIDIYIDISIGLGVRVFANGPGDPGRVIPKTQKMVLDASLLSTQHYKVRIKGKVEQSRKGVAPSPTHWCSSYQKGSLRVTLDYGRQLYFTYMFILIFILLFIYLKVTSPQ